MKTTNFFGKFTSTALLVGLFSVFASAQAGPQVDSDTAFSELEMTATVQTSVQLNISTGIGGATVTGSDATGLFSVSLGNVNGLGNGTPAAGVSKAASGDGFNYSTPINLTPVFSGFPGVNSTVTVEAGESNDNDIALEGSSAGSMTGISNTPREVLFNAESGSNNERVVGFYVARGEVAGSKTATFVYTLSLEID